MPHASPGKRAPLCAAGAHRLDARQAAFDWAGAEEPGRPLLPIAGPRLLIEFDNTRNGANHIHTVVRDPVSDFGDDVLAAHLRELRPPARRGSGAGPDVHGGGGEDPALAVDGRIHCPDLGRKRPWLLGTEEVDGGDADPVQGGFHLSGQLGVAET